MSTATDTRRAWYQKKRYVIPLVLAIMVVIGSMLPSSQDSKAAAPKVTHTAVPAPSPTATHPAKPSPTHAPKKAKKKDAFSTWMATGEPKYQTFLGILAKKRIQLPGEDLDKFSRKTDAWAMCQPGHDMNGEATAMGDLYTGQDLMNQELAEEAEIKAFCPARSAALHSAYADYAAAHPNSLPLPTPKPTPKPTPTKTAAPAPTAMTVGEEQALGSAKDYLDTQAFSRKGLIEQLEYEGFKSKNATFAADHVGADWNVQAGKDAREYLNTEHFSRKGLIEQLEYEGFTPSQASYGATKVGL